MFSSATLLSASKLLVFVVCLAEIQYNIQSPSFSTFLILNKPLPSPISPITLSCYSTYLSIQIFIYLSFFLASYLAIATLYIDIYVFRLRRVFIRIKRFIFLYIFSSPSFENPPSNETKFPPALYCAFSFSDSAAL